jgi:hypothetical protein
VIVLADKRRYTVRLVQWKDMTMANICDEELIGSNIDCGGHLMHISPEYFDGPSVAREEALELVRSSAIVNLVGDRIVRHVIRAKLASSQGVRRIGATSFLMIFKFVR